MRISARSMAVKNETRLIATDSEDFYCKAVTGFGIVNEYGAGCRI